jgi:hypothetical protein
MQPAHTSHSTCGAWRLADACPGAERRHIFHTVYDTLGFLGVARLGGRLGPAGLLQGDRMGVFRWLDWVGVGDGGLYYACVHKRRGKGAGGGCWVTPFGVFPFVL